MPAATFDGANRVVVLPSGSSPIEIDVQADLYSAWKQFVQVSDNAKFAPAFRTIAGDPLPGGLIAEPYFFLQNQAQTTTEGGWRIRPAEQNTTYNLLGNLVPEDDAFDTAVVTTGSFTNLLLGIQPVTQGTDAILTTQTSLLTQNTQILNNIATRKEIDFTGDDTAGWQEVLYDSLGAEYGRFNLFDETKTRINETVASFVARGGMIADRIPA